MNNNTDNKMYNLATELSEYAENKGVNTTLMAGALAILVADCIIQTKDLEKPLTFYGFTKAVKAILEEQPNE